MANFVAQRADAGPSQMLSICAAVNKALRAETASIGRVTVAAGVTTVTITDPRCRYGRLAILIPLDAAAAAAHWYLSNMTQEQMTFTFTSAPGASEWGYAFLGDGNQ